MTFDPTVVVWHKCHVSVVLMTKSGWNRSKHVKAVSLRSVARRKKEKTRHCCRHRRRTLPAGRQRPPWPQFDPLSCKCYRGSEANACIWVTWIHYVTRRRESIVSENQDLTPNDPRLTFDPINANDVTKKSFWIFSHLCLRQVVQWVSFLSLEVVIWPFFHLWPVNRRSR